MSRPARLDRHTDLLRQTWPLRSVAVLAATSTSVSAMVSLLAQDCEFFPAVGTILLDLLDLVDFVPITRITYSCSIRNSHYSCKK